MTSSTKSPTLDPAKILREIVQEIIGASTNDLKLGKVETILSEKIGAERLMSFKRSLARRGSNATDAWTTFVKSLECVKCERTGPQSSLKLKLRSAHRKQEIQRSLKTNILDDLSIYEYRMAILCEALKTALDGRDSGNIDHQGSGGNTVLHFLSALPIDTKERQTFNVNIVKFLVENNIDCSIKNDKGLTALHILTGNYVLDPRIHFEPSAIGRGLDCKTSTIGRYKVLCCFNMAMPFDVRGPHGNSILHEWVIQRAIRGHDEHERNKDEELIGTWIINTASVSPNKTNDYGCTSLHYALRIHLIHFLCGKGADKERRNDSDETPLIYILKHCFLRGIVGKFLPPESDLEATLTSCLGIRINNDKNLGKIVAFHSMTLETLEKFLKSLANAGFNFNEKDALNENRDCLDCLLCILRECVCKGCKKENGQQFKTFKCLLKCVKMLIESGSILVTGEKAGRKSPLYQILLLYFNSLQMLHEEIKNQIVECVEKMLEAGADPNASDINGNTVLHFCCQAVDARIKQQKKIVHLLCEYGASPTTENKDGDTPTKILENRNDQQCTKLAKCIATLKPRLWVKVDYKSERYKDGLDNLCRKKCPDKEGSIRYDLDHIGRGAMSFIFLAIDEKSKREVALKRILKASFENELQNEIKSLVKLEQNSNVVKYYCLEENRIFYFLALELMEGDLCYLVREYKSLKIRLDDEEVTKLSTDVVKGLSFLHHLQIIHRDLKPGNILFRLDSERKPCLKLADFGLAKHLTPSVNQSTVLGGSTSSSLTGTRGWMAPELVGRKVQVHSESTDMFALGLVLHFLISKGFHPFDQSRTPLFKAVSSGTLKPHELEACICKGKPEHLWKDLIPEARHLIELILSDDPSRRPSAGDLLKQNCYFWSKLKKVEFMKAVGDQKEIASPSPGCPFGLKLEGSSFGDQVRTNSWDMKLKGLWDENSPRRSNPYRPTTVVDLIRFFRNAYAHYDERSETCKNQLLNDVFFAKFPDFFLTVWKVVRDDMGWLKANSGREWLLWVVNEMD